MELAAAMYTLNVGATCTCGLGYLLYVCRPDTHGKLPIPNKTPDLVTSLLTPFASVLICSAALHFPKHSPMVVLNDCLLFNEQVS